MVWLLFPLFAFLMTLRVPVAFALVLSAGIALFASGYHLDTLPQKMFTSLNNPILMAVPGFIFAGVLMSKGGISKALIHALKTWVGHLPGGLSVVTILACAVFAAICGSSPATAAAIGAIMIPGMVEAGYSKKYAMGLVAASGTLGILIPPSIPLIVYGMVSQQSIGKLFMAGVVPGILLTFVLIVVAIVYAKIKNFGRLPKASWKERMNASVAALPAAFLPVLILGTIYLGIATPTEASVVACVYSLLVATIIYRQIKWSNVRAILVDTTNTSSMIFLIIAAATVFGLFLTNNQIPQEISHWIMENQVHKWSFLLATNILFFIMGMFLEPTSITLITLPVFLPIFTMLGIDPIHFAIIMTINMELGMITPPVGLNLFVVSSIGKAKLEEVVRGVLPFILILIVVLIFIAIFPVFSLWLPNLMSG